MYTMTTPRHHCASCQYLGCTHLSRATVDTFPEAFFVCGASVFFLSALCLLFVKVRRPKWNGYSAGASGQEEADMDANESQISQL